VFLLVGAGGVNLFPDGWPRFLVTAIAIGAAFKLGADWQRDQSKTSS
jgi:hypothetical protein